MNELQKYAQEKLLEESWKRSVIAEKARSFQRSGWCVVLKLARIRNRRIIPSTNDAHQIRGFIEHRSLNVASLYMRADQRPCSELFSPLF